MTRSPFPKAAVAAPASDAAVAAPASDAATAAPFHGRAVVRAAFIIATFGWGVGFYGPPVFLHAVMGRTGWSLGLVSAAVTFHFLLGAAVVAGMPRLHARFGIAGCTVAGAVALAVGIVGWAWAATPWALFVAAGLSGGGWVLLGAAAINAMIAPWFVRGRARALARAYNGASLGGVIFSPLWSVLIAQAGFGLAAVLVGVCLVGVVAALAYRVLLPTPQRLGQHPDGSALAPMVRGQPGAGSGWAPLPGRALWRERRFRTLAAGMAFGRFAQIGLLAHLYSLLAVRLGTLGAGVAMALATACAVLGRTVAARRVTGSGASRRRMACASYAVQAVGALVLLVAVQGDVPALVWVGVVLFGAGIGNATSLPPLIAQADFAASDVSRVVALIVAMSQASYAFAPMVFGLLRDVGPASSADFITAAGAQTLAIVCLWRGTRIRT